jgi:hypothetical protein
MNRTLAPAGIAHYDPRLTKPSTLLAPHGRSCRATGPCGAARCGLPAEVRCRFTMRSTDGPIECGTIRCPAGHWFSGAIESLTCDSTDNHDPGAARLGSGGPAQRDFPAEPERNGRCPNGAPACYLGRPAAPWITAIRPLRAHPPSLLPDGSRRHRR